MRRYILNTLYFGPNEIKLKKFLSILNSGLKKEKGKRSETMATTAAGKGAPLGKPIEMWTVAVDIGREADGVRSVQRAAVHCAEIRVRMSMTERMKRRSSREWQSILRKRSTGTVLVLMPPTINH